MKLKIVLFLLVIGKCLNAQTDNTFQPILWLRADSNIAGNCWQDVSDHANHAYFHSSSPVTADSSLNFNRSFSLNTDIQLVFDSLQVLTDVNHVLIVYQSNSSHTEEMPLWNIQTDGTHQLALTTQRIINDESTIVYTDSIENKTILNSLTQLWRKSTMPDTLYCEGQIGSSDSSAFVGEIAEFIILPCNETDFQDTLLLQWLSYLSIKYGITLKDMSYVSSSKKTIWPQDTLASFSYYISAIGRDDYFSLYQKQSYVAEQQLIMGVGALATTNEANVGEIENENYLFVGCDESAFTTSRELYLENDTTLLVYGNAVAKVTGNKISTYPTFLQVNAETWEGDLEDYVLLIDRSGEGGFPFFNVNVYSPDSIDTLNKVLYFSNIQWDTDHNGKDVFCFGQWQTLENNLINERSSELSGPGLSDSETLTGNYALYPNPNNGHFTIDIEYPQTTALQIRIFSSDGRMIKTLESQASLSHHIESDLLQKGQYLLEIVSAKETQVIKMIVQ